MKLPNAELAVVPAEKVRDYLLSGSHPVGRFKARFFRALGYTQDNWEEFSDLLRSIAESGDAEEVTSSYGRKFRIRFQVAGADQESVSLLTIWLVPSESEPPRLVTAYPEE